ncbi:MAG: hypothetical protein IPF41_12380 [Flavobacteriales bacterium]|nr:hypothetical protein [Flavobacteriales bacterium]
MKAAKWAKGTRSCCPIEELLPPSQGEVTGLIEGRTINCSIRLAVEQCSTRYLIGEEPEITGHRIDVEGIVRTAPAKKPANASVEQKWCRFVHLPALKVSRVLNRLEGVRPQGVQMAQLRAIHHKSGVGARCCAHCEACGHGGAVPRFTCASGARYVTFKTGSVTG